jgi:hypothetical protein
MTLEIAAPGDGYLTIAKVTMYTAPASTSGIEKTITLVNGHGSAVTVNLYVNRTGADRNIMPVNMNMDSGDAYFHDTVITLLAGDIIKGSASVDSVVHYVISGAEDS